MLCIHPLSIQMTTRCVSHFYMCMPHFNQNLKNILQLKNSAVWDTVPMCTSTFTTRDNPKRVNRFQMLTSHFIRNFKKINCALKQLGVEQCTFTVCILLTHLQTTPRRIDQFHIHTRLPSFKIQSTQFWMTFTKCIVTSHFLVPFFSSPTTTSARP